MPLNTMDGYGEFTRTDEQLDREILYSANDMIKKGGIVKAGEGVLLTGTVLGIDTATGKLVAYDNAATDGSETAVGILGNPVDTTLNDVPANIYFAGWFKTALLVGMDAGALTDLGAKVNTHFGWTHIG